LKTSAFRQGISLHFFLSFFYFLPPLISFPVLSASLYFNSFHCFFLEAESLPASLPLDTVYAQVFGCFFDVDKCLMSLNVPALMLGILGTYHQVG
jgi:hypothetical protein